MQRVAGPQTGLYRAPDALVRRNTPQLPQLHGKTHRRRAVHAGAALRSSRSDTPAAAATPPPATAAAAPPSSLQQPPIPPPRPARAARAAAAALAAAAQLLAAAALGPPPADALLSSPGAQVPRSVDAALRRATPAFNAEVQQVQRKMEDIAFLLRIPQVGRNGGGGGVGGRCW
jgi:hypothetical protein